MNYNKGRSTNNQDSMRHNRQQWKKQNEKDILLTSVEVKKKKIYKGLYSPKANKNIG